VPGRGLEVGDATSRRQFELASVNLRNRALSPNLAISRMAARTDQHGLAELLGAGGHPGAGTEATSLARSIPHPARQFNHGRLGTIVALAGAPLTPPRRLGFSPKTPAYFTEWSHPPPARPSAEPARPAARDGPDCRSFGETRQGGIGLSGALVDCGFISPVTRRSRALPTPKIFS